MPRDFQFSVKIPKEISHQRKLVDCREPLDSFAAQVAHLGNKLGVLLLQLPPKLAFDPGPAEAFLETLAALLPALADPPAGGSEAIPGHAGPGFGYGGAPPGQDRDPPRG